MVNNEENLTPLYSKFDELAGLLGMRLDRIIEAVSREKLPDYSEPVMLSNQTTTVQVFDYPYNYLLVSSQLANAMGSQNLLTIDMPGFSYTQAIYEGWNRINVRGSTAKFSIAGLSQGYPAVWIQSNDLFGGAGNVTTISGNSSGKPLIAELTGSLAPLTAAPPTLLLTVPYSDFTASSDYFFTLSGVLHRNARARSFVIYNSMNEALTGTGFDLEDSAIKVGAPSGFASLVNYASQGSTVTYTSTDNKNNLGYLGAAVDSIRGFFGMGATAPTSGNVYLYVTEVF